jgi:hypothetical protein
MATKKIKGRIIRILDKKTVIINLGKMDNIDSESIFYILGDPEPVVDPFTKSELGLVNVTKARVKASQVFDKFTIATTKWTDYRFIFEGLTLPSMTRSEVYEGELLVDSKDIQPWKAKSEVPVRIGDEVEVSIQVIEEQKEPDSKKDNKSPKS